MGVPRVPARPGRAGKKLIEAARLLARGDLISEQQDKDDADDLDAQLAAQGVVLADEDDEPCTPVVYLLPDQLEAWHFWHHCDTQWRHGFGGPTGLDYPGVEHLMGQLRIPRHRRARLWAQVRAMERGALIGWSQQREEKKRDC